MPRTSETETHQAQPKHTPHTPVRRTPRRKLDARDDEIILDVLLADRRLVENHLLGYKTIANGAIVQTT
jgi:hypothetical protein